MKVEIYKAIEKALQDSNVKYIDINKGQLNAFETGYPFPLPAVLVSFPNAPSEHMSGYLVEQMVDIEVKLILNEITESFNGSTTQSQNLNRYNLTKDIINRLVFLSDECYSEFQFNGETEAYPKAETHITLDFSTVYHTKLQPYVSK